eukprot:EG_transcript_5811
MGPPTPGPSAVVVVDPYSSGRYLLCELRDRGLPIICVRSSLKLGPFFLQAYDRHRAFFAATVDHEDLPSTLAQLQALPYTIVAVLPGCEPGVALADTLAEALQLPNANGTALLPARKDKAQMQEQLARCGVPAAQQVRSGELAVLLAWVRGHGRWPVVVKPLCGSGSDGIYFCQDEAAVAAAHRALIGAVANGQRVDELVVQEFLTGTEYIVDTVSHAGRHIVVAIWQYTKRHGTPWSPTCIICEHNDLLPSAGPVQDRLAAYISAVLDAVGLRYGPCHSEVMLTPRGPILVEVNARLHGLQGSELIGAATGTSKAAAAVDVMVGGALRFEERYVPPPGRYLYPLEQHCTQMLLISPVEGFLQQSLAAAVEALALPSVYKVLPAYEVGQYLVPSTDLNNAAGYVLLVCESQEQIRHDMQRIREAEEDGRLYRVSRDAPATGDPPPAGP